jgi:enamine deaminase RidA (YjgF/YER057c/UK114 family)
VEGALTHRIVNPEGLAPPSGFSHAVVAGRTIYLGGQAGHDADGKLVGDGLLEQFDQACANVVTALEAAGGTVADLASLHIYVTDGAGYRSSLKELGEIYRRHFGGYYPAISWFEIAGLFDPAAKVELVCTAVTGTAPGR